MSDLEALKAKYELICKSTDGMVAAYSPAMSMLLDECAAAHKYIKALEQTLADEKALRLRNEAHLRQEIAGCHKVLDAAHRSVCRVIPPSDVTFRGERLEALWDKAQDRDQVVRENAELRESLREMSRDMIGLGLDGNHIARLTRENLELRQRLAELLGNPATMVPGLCGGR